MATLRLFVCKQCGVVDSVPGGTSNYHCGPCREVNGMPDLTTPQYLAHKAVARAIRKKQLPRPARCACVDCGAPAFCYDHRDYSEPLKVDPVCRSCNTARGAAINHITPANTRADQRSNGLSIKPVLGGGRLNNRPGGI
jgi:hypothetical protein